MAGVRDILLFSPAATAGVAASPYHPNIALLSSATDHHHMMTPVLLSPSPFIPSNIPVAPPHSSAAPPSSAKKLRPSSVLQDGSFKESLPRHVRAPATFRCVRLTTVGGGSEAEFAYQALVRIGGHVFRGVLYHEGRAAGANGGGGEGNSNDTGDSVREVSEQLHLHGGNRC